MILPGAEAVIGDAARVAVNALRSSATTRSGD
jgi:hypothetical protein